MIRLITPTRWLSDRSTTSRLVAPKLLLLATMLLGPCRTARAQTLARYNLNFNPNRFTEQTVTYNGKSMTVRAYEKIVYVASPVDTTYQILNVFVPGDYFVGKSINGYTAQTAPIFFPNRIGGYMPATPATALNNGGGGPGGPPPGAPQGGPPPGVPGGGMSGGGRRESAVVVALSKGYVVASAGARGRTTPTGKAPAHIVDLKAAIRYLKYNDRTMPGDANRIISNGTSAGGALSVLLGATGNNPDYESYLTELGAAPATDDIFAVSAYCPITNLDHADMAYEWQFNGINTYQPRGPMSPNANARPAMLSPEQITLSDQLKPLFPTYLNSLKLRDKAGKPLTLDKDGNGSFKDLVSSYLVASAQKALDSGTDLSKLSWLTITNGKITTLDYPAYPRYLERMKTPPAFDALDLSTPENQLFGTATVDKQHFASFSEEHRTTQANLANARIVKMMNPMDYIGTANTKTAPHWRIRHGSKDKDTSLGIPVMLGTYLQNKGYDVDLALPWDRPHSGDYDLDELFEWMDGVVKSAKK